ncbi:hypothetical protein [Peterkaempfera bronchialis]|uniref:Uncharacterized protein n=1 Tax=Peterkaempfera bronchialis TaxID=2126346 RepID=A0A345SUP8_9ACTN|nr:hypothetical protein [Peterkaempfera bronchialis]AXI77453.1 hypothetical protein C7M71_008370 [Peterkaempfera bronchialis]
MRARTFVAGAALSAAALTLVIPAAHADAWSPGKSGGAALQGGGGWGIDGGKDEGRDEGRDWGKDGGRDEGRDFGREGGRDEGRDFGREGGHEEGREWGKGGREHGHHGEGGEWVKDEGREFDEEYSDFDHERKHCHGREEQHVIKEERRHERPHGGVHTGGGGMASTGGLAAGGALLAGGLGAGAWSMRRRNNLGRAI